MVNANFDLEWRGYSYGIQPEVDQFAAARTLDVAGIEIYHPTRDHHTGTEIAFGGDLARPMRGGRNYLGIETEAQGFPEWTPYPGQLRLQSFSHLASGANMVEYWHWGTTANAIETYWRGLLSPSGTATGEHGQTQPHRHLRQQRGTHGVQFFRLRLTSTITYNDVLRPFYDALNRMNAEVDLVDPSTTDLSAYTSSSSCPRSTLLPMQRSNVCTPSLRREAICSTPSRAGSPTSM